MFLFCIDPYTLYVATCTQGDLDLFTSYEVTSGTHVNDTCTRTLSPSLSLSLSLYSFAYTKVLSPRCLFHLREIWLPSWTVYWVGPAARG